MNCFFFLPRSVENHTGKIFELVVEAKDQGSPPKISRALVRVRVLDTINSRPEIYVDILSSTGEGRAEVSWLHGTFSLLFYPYSPTCQLTSV